MAMGRPRFRRKREEVEGNGPAGRRTLTFLRDEALAASRKADHDNADASVLARGADADAVSLGRHVCGILSRCWGTGGTAETCSEGGGQKKRGYLGTRERKKSRDECSRELFPSLGCDSGSSGWRLEPGEVGRELEAWIKRIEGLTIPGSVGLASEGSGARGRQSSTVDSRQFSMRSRKGKQDRRQHNGTMAAVGGCDLMYMFVLASTDVTMKKRTGTG